MTGRGAIKAPSRFFPARKVIGHLFGHLSNWTLRLDMATKWAEYKRNQREKAKLEKAAELEAEPTITDEPHPVYPNLKRYSDRIYDENGLVLKEQHCEACKGVYAASIEIPCVYCNGTGVRRVTTITR